MTINFLKGNGFESTNNKAINIGQGGNIVVTTNAVHVNVGMGHTSSLTSLDIGAGDGIIVNPTNVAVKYDNSSIVLNGSGQLSVPGPHTYISHNSINSVGTTTLPSIGTFTNIPDLTFSLPGNSVSMIVITFTCSIPVGLSLSDAVKVRGGFNGSVTFDMGYVHKFTTGVSLSLGTLVSDFQYTCFEKNITTSPVTKTLGMSLIASTANASITNKNINYMIFPISP